MKAHTPQFKEKIKEFGRQIDAKITYELNGEQIELGGEQLNSITPTYQADILKSVMKQLDIDSNVEIPLETILKCQFGVLIDDEYEYIDFGNYIVYSSEKQEDTGSYKITCYDMMLRSMTEYHKLDTKEFPMTVKEYITTLCNEISLEFSSDNFVNQDRVIETDLYAGLGYTYRDILDELAQVTASTICINNDNEVEIRYINNTNDTIDEEYLKDINVNFGEKYGPINSIVLSRAAESDNVYLQDEVSIETNGLHELKIVDNQIMNYNDRSDYLPEILSKLDGLEYYINDFSSTGICYYDVCDRYNIQIGESIYSCVMLNDEINITQGLEENIHTDMPEDSETDYIKADKTDRRINQTYLIVDKQNQKIESLASQIMDLTREMTSTRYLHIEDAFPADLITFKIYGPINLIYPHDDIFPEDELFMLDTNLIISRKYPTDGILYPKQGLYPSKDLHTTYNGKKIHLPITSLGEGDVFIFENQECRIEKKDGTIEDLGKLNLELYEGENYIYLQSFYEHNIKYYCKYAIKSEYTNIFATKLEMQSSIQQTADQINLEVSKKADEKDIVSIINQSAEQITIKSNRLVIDSDNFSLTPEGKMKSISGEIAGFKINSEDGFEYDIYAPYDYDNDDLDRVYKIASKQITPTEEDFIKYDLDGNGTITYADYVRIRWYVKYNITTYSPGKFEISIPDTSSLLTAHAGYLDSSGNLITGFSYNRGYFPYIEAEDIYVSNKIIINDTSGEEITRLENDGHITCKTLTQTSLEEKKKNIEEVTNAKAILNDTDIYKYNFKNEDDNEKKHIGLIIGNDYNYSKELTSKKNDSVDIYSMVSVLWQVVKEQQKEINELKEMIKNGKNNF